MNNFAIYWFQFNKDNGSEKAYNTTMIGEVNLASEKYKTMTPKEACLRRIKEELSMAKNRGCNSPYDDVAKETINFTIVKYKGESGADKQIHEWLVNQNYVRLTTDNGRLTEEFNLGTNYRTIIEKAITAKFGKPAVEPYTLRSNQIDLINKMSKAFENNYCKFLCAANCRFGKTLPILDFCTVQKKYLRILILSSKCDALLQWISDYYKFINNGYSIYTKDDLQQKNQIFTDENMIVVLSFQSSAKNYFGPLENETWQSILKKFNFDIIIIDECHYGVVTLRSQNFLNYICTPKTLITEISATPYTKILRHEYNTSNSYIYDLFAEYNDAIKNNYMDNYSKYVPVKFYHLDLYKDYKNNGLTFNGERNSMSIQKQLTELFNVTFNDVVFSWDSYFMQFTVLTLAQHFSSLFNNYFQKHGKNFAVYVSKVEHAKKLEEALTNKFNIINVAGDNKKYSVYTINEILKNANTDNTEKPVIIISCDRYLTGTTLTYLHGLIFMGTCNSAQTYIQYGMRPKNTYPNRKYACTIFDLNPKCFLKTDAFKTLVRARALYTNQSIEDTLKSDFNANCFEIFELNDGHNFSKITDFAKTISKTWYLSDDGGISKVLFDDIIDSVDIEKMVNTFISDGFTLNNVTLNNKIIPITDPQCGVVKCKRKTKIKRSSNNEQTDPQDFIQDTYKIWIQKFYKLVNYLPFFLRNYELTSLNDLFMSDKYKQAFQLLCDTDIKILKKFKEYCEQNNTPIIWQDLNNSILNIIKNFED